MRYAGLIPTFVIFYLRNICNIYLSVTLIPTIILRVFVILTDMRAMLKGERHRHAKLIVMRLYMSSRRDDEGRICSEELY